MFSRRRQIIGHVDRLQGDSIVGWAADENALNDILDVAVIADDRVIGEGRADQFRADLVAAGYGHGNHGFTVSLSEIPGRLNSFSVIAYTGKKDLKASVNLGATTRAEIMRAFLAHVDAVELPPSIRDACSRVKGGKFSVPNDAPGVDESVYFSDELFMRTMLAFAEAP